MQAVLQRGHAVARSAGRGDRLLRAFQDRFLLRHGMAAGGDEFPAQVLQPFAQDGDVARQALGADRHPLLDLLEPPAEADEGVDDAGVLRCAGALCPRWGTGGPGCRRDSRPFGCRPSRCRAVLAGGRRKSLLCLTARRGRVTFFGRAAFGVEDHLGHPLAQALAAGMGKGLGDLSGLRIDTFDAPGRSGLHRLSSPGATLG
ncbi:hypothetical protein ACFOGJ_28180 [Marinibaculum pumilum]|uniref:Uncharacterized protein n=1 Tax=Marinibaculum pumilum TaxID=1766165 RepID=A0ABV7L9K5_9PROT